MEWLSSDLVTDLELASLSPAGPFHSERAMIAYLFNRCAGKGRSFLDLGCGVPGEKVEHASLGGERCTDLLKQGWAPVFGVDVSEWTADPPSWTFIRGDLTERTFWERMEPGFFDLVSSRFLVSTRSTEISPQLVLESGLRPYMEFPNDALPNSKEYRDFLRFFFSQVYRVMKLGGLFAWNDRHLFVKEREGLAPYNLSWIPVGPFESCIRSTPSAKSIE